jgi:hypothetical protein
MDDNYSALAAAVRDYKVPQHRRAIVRERFPDGMLLVIRAAANDEELLNDCAGRFSLAKEEVREASRHYLLSILSNPKLTGSSILGLNPGSDARSARLHRKWLLKWLHPDHNPSSWEQQLYRKVSALPKDLFEDGTTALVGLAQPRREGARRSQHRLHHPVPHARRGEGRRIIFGVLTPILASVVLAVVLLWWFEGVRHHQALLDASGGQDAPHGVSHVWQGELDTSK